MIRRAEEISMADPKRRERGLAKMQEVYAGDVVVPPPGGSAFADLMLEQLFGEVWTREELPLRDRRLITMGVIAALGERDTFAIQVRAALKNGELSPAQVREVLIHLAQYAGYPRAAGLLGVAEKAIAEFQKAAAEPS
jgi:4-carboxymuconolactone decarboxylase